MKALFKYTLVFAMTVLVLLAMVISLARYFMPSLDQYEQQITDLIAKELQLDVKFGSFAGDWYRLGPAIKVTDIVLSSHTGEIVTQIDTLYISFNLLTSITQRQLVPAYLNVIGLELDLDQKYLIGQEGSPKDHHFVLDLLKQYSNITIRRSQINFKDIHGNNTPVYLRRLVLSRTGKSHQLDVMLNLLNHPTRFEMVAKISGDLAKPENLAVNGYLKVDNAVIDNYLKSYHFKGYGLEDGLVDMDAWIDWRDGQLQSLQAEVNLQQLQVQSSQNLVLKPFDIQGAFLWERQSPDEWTLSSHDLRLGIDELELMPLVTQFKLTQNAQAYQFVADKIILGNVTQALLWTGYLPEQKQQLLIELAPHGDFDKVKLNWQGNHWEAGLRFNQLTYQAVEDIPGARDLSGELMATQSTGKVSFSSTDTQVDYTALFPYPMLFSSITGDIAWQNQDEVWEFKSDNLVLENQNEQIKTDFVVKAGKTMDTHVDANVLIPQLMSTHLYNYLPVTELSSELAQWFKTSMGQGQLEQITMKTYGPYKDFPYFDEGNGIFRLHMTMQDLAINFDPDWPKLEKASGQLLFSGRNVEIDLDKAEIFQTEILGLSGHIGLPAIGTSWLKIHGEAVTQAQNAVALINATPLRETLGHNLDMFAFNMPLTVTLDLDIPLDSETDETQVKGVAQVSEGDITLKDWQINFSNIHGIFSFTQHGIESQGIHADLLGKPVIMTMTPRMKGSEYLTDWQLQGGASVTDMVNYFPSSLWNYVTGESQFSAHFTTGMNTSGGFDFVVASDLKGIEINLPAPLGKTKESLAPMRYTTTVGHPTHMQMRLEYNKIIDGIFQFTEKENTSKLTGGRVKLGSALDTLEVPAGIIVTGSLPSFSYDIWDEFIAANKKQASTPQEKNTAYDQVLQQIKQINVTINELDVFHFPLHKAQVNITQGKNQWLLNLKSRDWGGKIAIPKQDEGIIALNLDYCFWDNTQHVEDKSVLDPRTIPALTFSCMDFTYDQKKLGQVKFNLVPEGSGLKLQQVSMTRVNDAITANGHWWVEQDKQNTEFTGHLDSNALDKTLALVDIKSTILGSKTKVDFDLAWPGDPFDFALASLNGKLDINLSKGVLVDVNPGFGRILSLLSIQSLERRLRLDFSDVFKKGFSFDTITALVNVKNGMAHSDNLLMKAPAAEMKMKGDVNLATKQLDLRAIVTTHITSSLPIAATIASGGNPIVGAIGVGVWAADKIVKSQAGDMLGTTYHVTGTWEKPIVNGK